MHTTILAEMQLLDRDKYWEQIICICNKLTMLYDMHINDPTPSLAQQHCRTRLWVQQFLHMWILVF